MSQDATLESLLETISSDSQLRDALLKHLVPAQEENRAPSQHVATLASSHQDDTVQTVLTSQASQPGLDPALAVSVHQSEQSSVLAAQTHQSDSTISRQSASATNDPLASHIHQSGRDMDAQDSSQLNNGERQLDINTRHQLESYVAGVNNEPLHHDFDPESLDTEDENTFTAHNTITEYLEKHFRRTLTKTTRAAMHKAHPVPRTAVTKAPIVDQFVKDYLKSRFPKQEDNDLGVLQSALLKVCGPMTCLWSDLIENNLLDDEAAVINVQDVMEIIQRSLVLLGNANELLSQIRRTNILQLADQSLKKYGQESPDQPGEFLFGPGFAKHLKEQVESGTSLAQVVSASRRYHPYNARTPTITRPRPQFFRGGPTGNRGSQRGRRYVPTHQSQYRGRGTLRSNQQYRPPAQSRKY